MKIEITKEDFCNIGKRFQKTYDEYEEYCTIANSIHLSEFICELEAPMYDFYYQALQIIFKSSPSIAETIDWFIYETHFGEKLYDIDEEETGKHWDVTSWEALYDYFVDCYPELFN